jgi:Uma2 family endonuclease
VFISHERYQRRDRTRTFLAAAPELLVEILSPENAHIDMHEKVEEYLAIGIRLNRLSQPDLNAESKGPLRNIRAGLVDSDGDWLQVSQPAPLVTCHSSLS